MSARRYVAAKEMSGQGFIWQWVVVKALARLPFRLLYILSDLLYPAFYYVVRYRRKVVRANLSSSFPNKSLSELKTIEKRFYHFFLDMLLETCKLLTMSEEEMQRRMTFSNVEAVRDYNSQGRSVAVFLGHFGNWEWISSTGLWMPFAKVAQIYHPLRNKAMDSIMLQLRERMRNVCIPMRATARFMAAKSAENEPQVIGFIADQSPKPREVSYFIPFLNHLTPVLTGTEKAAKHFGYEFMFIAVRRVRRGFYECEFVSLADDGPSLPDYEATRRYYERLEEEINAQPELYLWSHKRFKFAKPLEEKE